MPKSLACRTKKVAESFPEPSHTGVESNFGGGGGGGEGETGMSLDLDPTEEL